MLSLLSFFPQDVLDEIWDLIESVSEGFDTYSKSVIYSSSTSDIFCSEKAAPAEDLAL